MIDPGTNNGAFIALVVGMLLGATAGFMVGYSSGLDDGAHKVMNATKATYTAEPTTEMAICFNLGYLVTGLDKSAKSEAILTRVKHQCGADK